MQICLPTISGKRRHSGDMGAKSQLNGGIFYIILWLMHVLQALSDKKRSYNMFWKTLAQQEDCMKSK
ncbi:hypothetical protein DMI70_19905 [Escherichia coli]|nr:hypothetical protein [Escherichia coli]